MKSILNWLFVAATFAMAAFFLGAMVSAAFEQDWGIFYLALFLSSVSVPAHYFAVKRAWYD